MLSPRPICRCVARTRVRRRPQEHSCPRLRVSALGSLSQHGVACHVQVNASGSDAFSRRKTLSKVYWTTIPKAQRDAIEAAGKAAGQEVQVNADGTAVLPTSVTGRLT